MNGLTVIPAFVGMTIRAIPMGVTQLSIHPHPNPPPEGEGILGVTQLSIHPHPNPPPEGEGILGVTQLSVHPHPNPPPEGEGILGVTQLSVHPHPNPPPEREGIYRNPLTRRTRPRRAPACRRWCVPSPRTCRSRGRPPGPIPRRLRRPRSAFPGRRGRGTG